MDSLGHKKSGRDCPEFVKPVANLITFYAHKLRLWGHNMEYFPVRYDSRVVIYERRMFIRLATGANCLNGSEHLASSLA